MGVMINSWITDSFGWHTMNRMHFATFSGGWRFSGARMRALRFANILGPRGSPLDITAGRIAGRSRKPALSSARGLKILLESTR